MNLDQKTKLLYCIISDYDTVFINNKKYIIKCPTSDLLYRAQLLYDNIIYNHRFNEWMGVQDCVDHLTNIGKLPLNFEQKCQEIQSFIEDKKVELYKSAIQLDKVKQIRKQLQQAKYLLDKLYDIQASLESFTVLGYAKLNKLQYIIRHTTYYKNKLCDYMSNNLLMSIIRELHKNVIPPEQFRELARTDPWRSYWGIVDNPFSQNVIDLDYNKRILISYSKMYDNVYESIDCPEENIIHDDDMLDGWMIVQRNKKQEQRNQSSTNDIVSNLGSKYTNATEIFLPTPDVAQANAIHSMNTAKSKHVQKQRQSMINKQGQVGVGKLPDEILERQLQMNQSYTSK
jgi:hypothetical protein